jgi:hypothetical protein
MILFIKTNNGLFYPVNVVAEGPTLQPFGKLRVIAIRTAPLCVVGLSLPKTMCLGIDRPALRPFDKLRVTAIRAAPWAL